MPVNSSSCPAAIFRGLDLYENQQLAGHLRGLLDAAHPPQVTQPRSDAARYRRKKGTALDPCRRIVLVGNLLAGQCALAEPTIGFKRACTQPVTSVSCRRRTLRRTLSIISLDEAARRIAAIQAVSNG